LTDTPVDHDTARRRMDPQFRSWLIQHMYAARFKKIDEQVDRFEVVASCLSHTDQRQVDFEALAEESGYAAHILRDTLDRMDEKLNLIEVTHDHEGTWYSLKGDPFSPPAPEDVVEELHNVESQVERLYRECCDEINSGLQQTVQKLEDLRSKVEPAVGSLLMDACADILKLREKLTRISATGVKKDREDYIRGLREEVRDLLREST
jgi:hypothetical protein